MSSEFDLIWGHKTYFLRTHLLEPWIRMPGKRGDYVPGTGNPSINSLQKTLWGWGKRVDIGRRGMNGANLPIKESIRSLYYSKIEVILPEHSRSRCL
ncbi:hypothetical protein CDAR_588241 [Caerostris darwini]|uniref:Uncharacterized protein n=1 Tax=Caerostris darwini TaxID=1538125 RepID=A0AAV4SA07_9ARAC|nr:hypothetical protein CDAR_588241 [Caerostris darwini]